MDKVFNVEIDGQITLPDGRKLGPFEETTVNVVQPSECTPDPIVENAKSTGGIGWTESGEQTVITWDGDTEGKTVVADSFCKVADSYFNNEEVVGMYITLSTGQSITVTQEMYDSLIEYGQIAEDFAFLGDNGEVVCVRKPNIDVFDYHFDETGIYFIYADGFGHTSSLTYGTPDTIHKIDEKYLPSGGAMVVEFVLNEDKAGFKSASKTVDEVRTAMLTGSVVGVVKSSVSGQEVVIPVGSATTDKRGNPAFSCYYDVDNSSWVETVGVEDHEWAFKVGFYHDV